MINQESLARAKMWDLVDGDYNIGEWNWVKFSIFLDFYMNFLLLFWLYHQTSGERIGVVIHRINIQSQFFRFEPVELYMKNKTVIRILSVILHC